MSLDIYFALSELASFLLGAGQVLPISQISVAAWLLSNVVRSHEAKTTFNLPEQVQIPHSNGSFQ